MAEIVDLRGRRAVPAPAPVLADPSGRRARLLSRVGRGISLVMLMWVIGLVLAGVGVLPDGDLPLGPAVAGEGGPVALRVLPRGAPPARSDLLPALAAARTPGVQATASSGAALRGRHGNAPSEAFARPGHPPRIGGGAGSARSGAVPGGSVSPGRGHGGGGSFASAGLGPGNSGAVAGTTASGGSSAAHGEAAPRPYKSTPAGNSGSAPGRLRQSTTTPAAPSSTSTTPGSSGAAPGRTSPPGKRYGNGG